MSRFRFRFAVVLKARERRRERARAALAAALATLGDAERIEREANDQIAAEHAATVASTAGGRVDAGDWLARRRHAGELSAQRARAVEEVTKARSAVAGARAELVAADRDVAALESLRDRDAALHRRGELAAEQRAAEDLFAAQSVIGAAASAVDSPADEASERIVWAA